MPRAAHLWGCKLGRRSLWELVGTSEAEGAEVSGVPWDREWGRKCRRQEECVEEAGPLAHHRSVLSTSCSFLWFLLPSLALRGLKNANLWNRSFYINKLGETSRWSCRSMIIIPRRSSGGPEGLHGSFKVTEVWSEGSVCQTHDLGPRRFASWVQIPGGSIWIVTSNFYHAVPWVLMRFPHLGKSLSNEGGGVSTTWDIGHATCLPGHSA